jgi:aerobic carbon-monoxide dehydrogenase medium subunit
MSRLLKPFGYFEPATVEEAIGLLSTHGDKAKVLAGGTDLIISMKRREILPEKVIYIKAIPGLDYIEYDQESGLRIGSLTTHSTIADSPIVRDKFGLLATACGKVGTPQIRNAGTIGGNICKAGPSQDTPPSLLVLDARLKLVSLNGERIIPIDQFFIAPFQTALKPIELITEIQIPPLPPRSAGCYKWTTKIVNIDETLVGVAVLIAIDPSNSVCSEIKIGLCSVAPTPMRARRAEKVLLGKKLGSSVIEQAAKVASEEIMPRSRADYRRKMTEVLAREAVEEVWQKVK